MEIGLRDILSRNQLPMWQFRKNCTFASVDLGVIMTERPKVIKKSISSVMPLLAKKIFFVPQPFKVYSVSEIEGAFRSFQSGKNYGKMAIDMKDQDDVQVRQLCCP